MARAAQAGAARTAKRAGGPPPGGKTRSGKTRGGGAEAGPRASLAWLQGLLCGGMVALAPALALLLGVLAAPSLLVLAFDRSPGRPALRAVALCNLAACVGPVRAFWSSGHRLPAGLALIADPRVLGLAWAAGAAGWLLGECLPLAIRVLLEATTAARAARLRARLAQIDKAWLSAGPE